MIMTDLRGQHFRSTYLQVLRLSVGVYIPFELVGLRL